jgi:hypothetical protein
MLNRIGRRAPTGWMSSLWRRLNHFAQKIAALSLIVLLLCPVCSTADDFHTCTLHSFPSAPHLLQLSLGPNDDQTDQAECLACQWRTVSDVIHVVRPFPAERHSLHSLTIERENNSRSHALSVRQDRAPPSIVCFVNF